ncbi:pentapeptide repeat-containing protein [Methylocella sp.]|uniref:pentapeptide repeat-containing protein n=1 Tax=Methylocella sp. TaxID=1978226 RepID=UPI00378396F4
MTRSTFLRLCSRAPRTAMTRPAGCAAGPSTSRGACGAGAEAVCAPLSERGRVLAGADLAGADLAGADLAGADSGVAADPACAVLRAAEAAFPPAGGFVDVIDLVRPSSGPGG